MGGGERLPHCLGIQYLRIIYFCPFKQSLGENGGKYVPPHVRQVEETEDAQKKEELERLKKQVKGLINR